MSQMIRTTLVLPLDVWRAVRYRAADEQTSLNALVLKALETAMAKAGEGSCK